MDELTRVRCLPERDWHEDIDTLVDYLTEKYRTHNGKMRLHPHQAAALADLHDYGGAVLPWAVGSGKSIPSFLAAHMVDAQRPLLLVPAKLRDKTLRDVDVYARDWKLPENLFVQSYETLARDRENAFLQEVRPDLMSCDECHSLSNTKTATWRRLRAYIKDRRKGGSRTWLVLASGTLMNRDLKEYWHLLRAALGDLAPIPADYPTMIEWSDSMSAKPNFFPPDPKPLHTLGKSDPSADPKTRARQAFGDRLARTPGIVFTTEKAPPYSLNIFARWVDLPEDLDEHFRRLRSEWLTPDDHPFDYPMQLWAHARQLACGFYYRPNPRPPESYVNARRNWNGYCADVLSTSRTYHSPGDVKEAIRDGSFPDPGGYLSAWEEAHAGFKLNQEAVWLDDSVLTSAAEWLEKEKGICWVEHLAFAEELAKVTGLTVYGQGAVDKEGRPLESEKGACISTLAGATGQNLQHNHHKNLIVSCVPTGKLHEQLIGRTHRFGQPEDEVTVDYMLACKEQFRGYWQATEDSRNVAESGFTPHAKLVIATTDVPTHIPMTGAAWD